MSEKINLHSARIPQKTLRLVSPHPPTRLKDTNLVAQDVHIGMTLQRPRNVVRGENGATACDHYHRFEEDFDLVQSGNFDAYRFSTSWARFCRKVRALSTWKRLGLLRPPRRCVVCAKH